MSKYVAVRLPPALVKAIDRFASTLGEGRSVALRVLVKRGLVELGVAAAESEQPAGDRP